MKEEIQNYYGKELQKSEDLKTNACCTLTPPPLHIRNALSLIHDEVQAKYYGCGLTIPSMVKGMKVLDLGSGSGRDCYILSKLVGEKGVVVGVDMTPEQLEVANKYVGYQADKFGYKKSNVSFVEGNIERLNECLKKDDKFDLVVSNCVLNLTSNKQKVLEDIFYLLNEGGEFYFSDVYADRRVSQELMNDPILWSECLSGALYWNDFLRLAKMAGFADPRYVESKEITVNNEELQRKLGPVKFFSVTYRLFKIQNLETDCEEYGQSIKYKGGVEEMPNIFVLDDHHVFEKGRMYSVCGNTYLMLNATRYKDYFEFYGNFEQHYGIFEGCGTNMPFKETTTNGSQAMACC
ncbi:MAG: methyltransferase domain-containing protein [Bacteriovoracaceae bacterium]|nr:methyltransferase domain-containing protein [Bacteriovoracaceae bacterium]